MVFSNELSFVIGNDYSSNDEDGKEEEEHHDNVNDNNENNDNDININVIEENEKDEKDVNINVIKENENEKVEKNEEKKDNTKTDGNISSENNSNNNNNMISIDSFEVFTTETVDKFINGEAQEGFFDNIKTIKELESEKRAVIIEGNKLESEEEIEAYKQQCLQKIAERKVNSLRTRRNTMRKEIKIFTDKEKNILEILSPKGDKINIFNPYLNEVEEILIPENYKFPKNFPYLNISPYCYVSGGIKTDEKGEMEELTNFYAIRRRGPKEFEFVNLPEMLESKSNHCMVELKYLNGIGVIGGSDSKNCEVFKFKQNIWDNLPELNNIRENPCSCVLNEKTLFCFFGYDNKSYKFNPNIEKLDLETLEKWDLISPKGPQVHM